MHLASQKMVLAFHFWILLLLLKIQEYSFETYHKKVFDECFSCKTETRLGYQMLINLEKKKSKLRGHSDEDATYSDLYVIEINDTHSKNIAEKYGFTFIRKVFHDENYYLYQRSKFKKRSKRQFEEFFKKDEYPEIQWADRQILKNRLQRVLTEKKFPNGKNHFLSELENAILQKTNQKSSSKSLRFNDPLFKQQWYLHNTGQTGSPPENDINVLPVWQSGITGRGVAISVLDDGVDGQSEEVADNYESKFSEDYLFRTPFHPIPENSHGTRCAAIAAGVANNGVCGVGVAYEAKVGGVRIIDGPLTDVQEAISLVHALDYVDIYTASWGPNDKGGEVDGPKIFTRMAFVKGVTMGRSGKGSIYIWAAGNGGGYYDNCSLDGYASNPFTLTIGALTEDGLSTFYSEACPSVIASTYVGGSSHESPTTKSWKEDQRKIKVVVPEGRGKCKETFQGTSAAAPMAAGIVALALQANPDLTWRDIQHLVIRTSRVPNTGEQGWFINGAGFHFHPKIGSGVLDANALITLARRWTTVDNLRVWKTPDIIEKWLLPTKEITSIPLRIQRLSMEPIQRIHQLETIIITVNLHHTRRGDLEMTLESPHGTASPVLTRRPHDNKTTGFKHWDFVSLHFWGEDPEGLWTLRVFNHNERITGFIDHLSMTLFGTKQEV